MKGFLAVAVVLVTAVAVQCRTYVPPNRIVGGESTTIENYPSLVQVDFFSVITSSWGHSCAGNILTSRWILSAAHCFEGVLFQISHRRGRLGATFRNVGGSLIGAERVINHEEYGTLGYHADISLVYMESPIEFNPAVGPGTIIAPNNVIPDYSVATLAGWGRLYSGGPLPADLQHVTVYTFNIQRCIELYNLLNEREGYNYRVTPSMICAGIPEVGGRDACQGDSGGPLYLQNIIIGIVSWGHGCANETYPGVKTDVSTFAQWIIDNAQ